VALEIRRLHLSTVTLPGTQIQWPVHGFVVDTGVGGPQGLQDDWRAVNVTAADALAALDMSPADITMVINTHLHFDHCGQNAVFKHAPFHVQRAELARAQRESPDLASWFDFAGARFELLDGDTEIMPGLSVITTPGHTVGHQSVLVHGTDGDDLLIGDAVYTPTQYAGPDDQELPLGQAADRESWAASRRRIRATEAARVHFCHHTGVIHS
jgi:N-acyl homoserine lactone hydrolase